jgi:Domain of unknown function (DUF4190)
MTTPQDPGGTPDDSAAPQDPADPQNPYGTPPPPPPNVPPADPTPPVTPPSTAIPPVPQAPPPYGATTPPYGDPSTPTAPPPYGDPSTPTAPPAYGQPAFPAYGTPTYGAPAYGAPTADEPGKGMAIAALISSLLGCTCIGALVAIPLAIVVLVRSRDGRNHGKGLAIAALIISALYLIGLVIGGYALYDYAKDFKNVDDLKAGQCITADGLTDDTSTGVTQIKSVSCSARHDGEVLATSQLTADEAAAFGDSSALDLCTPPVTAAGSVDLLANPDLLLVALTQEASPASGDKLVCVVTNADGSKLTDKLGS